MPFLDKKDINPSAGEKKFTFIDTAEFLMWITRLKELNKHYDKMEWEKPHEFPQVLLDYFNIKSSVTDADLKNIPKEGPFIIISNHPFGFLDGVIMINKIAEIRPEFKVMVNFLLHKVEVLRDFFIYVNPFENQKGDGKSVAGIKTALRHLRDGHPLGIFPAGEVSTFQNGKTIVADKEWNQNIIRFVEKAKVPVIPVFFNGKNSVGFHLMGLMHPMLRTIKIPSELIKKRNRTVSMRIGKPISPEDLSEFKDTTQVSRYLRAKVYSLNTESRRKGLFKPNLEKRQEKQARNAEEVMDAIPKEDLAADIAKLPPEALLDEQRQYKVYFASAEEVPNVVQELGRLRELSFRSVGEGTNRSTDIDEFDSYYRHLFVWDEEEQALIGAYRIGLGKDIIKSHGQKGFYLTTLFRMRKEFNSILSHSFELGRSFVIPEYQKRPFPLLMLWKGLSYLVHQYSDYKYLIGPVSISNDYSHLSKCILVSFIKQYHYDHNLAQFVKPRRKFKLNLKLVDAEILMDKYKDSLMELEKHIEEIEPERFKLPVLLKKYIKQNAKIIAFNVDPDFNFALDGLMICKIDDLPLESAKNLYKRE